jgi:putative membrane protein
MIYRLAVSWLINTVGVYLAATFVTGISVTGLGSALIAALVIGLLNAVLKPILIFFSIPFIALTLGLFLLVINAFLLFVASYFVSGFRVDGFLPALIGSIVISLISWILGMFLLSSDK